MFELDPLSRTTMRRCLALQAVALTLALGLHTAGLFLEALAVSLLALLLLLGVLRWLYVRYRGLPIVREKRAVLHLVPRFERKVREEERTIQAVGRERDRLLQAEAAEVQAALQALQKRHIEEGLLTASVREAVLPGLGPRQRERLVEHGIRSAADLSDARPALTALQETERTSLLEWRRAVLEALESAKPACLPPRQREAIQKKYQALHARNDLLERQAVASAQVLEHELVFFRPRLRLLRGVTFFGYVSTALAPGGAAALLIASLLAGTQIVSAAIAATSSIRSSLP